MAAWAAQRRAHPHGARRTSQVTSSHARASPRRGGGASGYHRPCEPGMTHRTATGLECLMTIEKSIF